MSVISRVATLSRTFTIDVDPFAELRNAISGEVITPEHADYNDARKVVYVDVDRRPAAIVKAESAQDVSAAVRFAVEQEFPLAVRSGGHSVAHQSVIDRAVVIDLARMKRVVVDPLTKTATVQAGATSGDLAGPAHAHGLGLSTGDTRSVGMGGLATGGGIGFMARKHGLTIDNLLSAQVVTAAGEIVTASETEHPDLFWAIRGGGGNFGIVTEFTFQLHDVGTVLGGLLILPATREIVRDYLDLSAAAPDDLTSIANLMHAPPMPFVPAERVGELVLAIIFTWTGAMAEGGRALAPFRALAEPIADTIAPMPYPEIYRYTDHQSAPHGAVLRSMFAEDISDATLDATFAAMEAAPSPFSIVHLRALGGAVGRVAPEATAFAHRNAPFFYTVIALWLDPADDGSTHRAWADELWGAVRTDAAGAYVNFLGDEGAARVRDAYPPATMSRLAAIKRAYDPTNLFRNNQNIAPRA